MLGFDIGLKWFVGKLQNRQSGLRKSQLPSFQVTRSAGTGIRRTDQIPSTKVPKYVLAVHTTPRKWVVAPPTLVDAAPPCSAAQLLRRQARAESWGGPFVIKTF